MRTIKAGACPTIGPVPDGSDRPFWSVMIPTYNPTEKLEKTLRSVLDQDPGPGRMQIAVVDDCSPNDEAERIVSRIAPGRVEFHRQPVNRGLAGNWNGSIERARGLWVHLLHQDDQIFPGFYERLGRAGRERPDAGAAFCRHYVTDGDWGWEALSEVERPDAGILDGWLAKISRIQRIQCASIVVRRGLYEQIGGYRTDLCLALDWEMWVRIAAYSPVWFEPEILARWLIHRGNESSRLDRAGLHIPDIFKAIEIIKDFLPAELRGAAGKGLLGEFRDREMKASNVEMKAGDHRAGLARLRLACRCDPSLRRSALYFRYRKWALKLWWQGIFSGTKPKIAAAVGERTSHDLQG